jgi:hypothetical protein
MDTTQNYWIGPYGIRVPNEITSIKAADGGNTLFKNGRETEMFVMKGRPSKQEYLDRYCVLKDGHYYWEEK